MDLIITKKFRISPIHPPLGHLDPFNWYQSLVLTFLSLITLSKMSHGDGPPPIFEGDDFPYWKIRMEAYLEALDVGILRAASQGFPKPRDATHLQGDEVNYEK